MATSVTIHHKQWWSHRSNFANSVMKQNNASASDAFSYWNLQCMIRHIIDRYQFETQKNRNNEPTYNNQAPKFIAFTLSKNVRKWTKSLEQPRKSDFIFLVFVSQKNSFSHWENPLFGKCNCDNSSDTVFFFGISALFGVREMKNHRCFFIWWGENPVYYDP